MTYTNKNPAQWVLVCADLEHANPGERFEEDFSDFGEDCLADDESGELEEYIDPQTGWVDFQ